jgi:hypothetical protein
VSNNVVLPWSTCPIIVTIGGLRSSVEASTGGLHSE